MWLSLLLAFTAFSSGIFAKETCNSCTSNGRKWCVDTNTCHLLTEKDCDTTIKNVLNCPAEPQSGYEYTDDFGRYVAMPIIVAAGMYPSPHLCLKNSLPTVTVKDYFHRKCSEYGPTNNTCHVYTAYDLTKKVIIISFRGTDTPLQLYEEFEGEFKKKEPFYNNGHIFKYFSDAYNLLWNEGLAKSVTDLKYAYPNFDVWVMGHSLGGALASTCASYLVKMGLADPVHTKLVTFGQPRTGDKEYAQWHDQTFLYSYRIVHHMDVVPHIPPLGGEDEPWHHRFEIWYNNEMAKTDDWVMCAEDDGRYCSNTQKDLSSADHMTYFTNFLGKDMYVWAFEGCHLDQL